MVRLHKRAIPAMKRLKHETFMGLGSGQEGTPEASRQACLRSPV
jgi:hypothetical protein